MKITSLAYSRPEDDPKRRKNPDAVRPAPSPLGLAALSVGGGGSSGTSVTINSTDTVIPYRSAANTFADSPLVRSTANIMEQRNGANTQTFRVYNTYTDASNYERGELLWTANTWYIRTVSAGTGMARDLVLRTEGAKSVEIQTNSTSRWSVNSSGHFIASTDNTYDIGASGATMPRNVYVGTAIYAPPGVSLKNVGRGAFGFTNNGVAQLVNAAETDFSRLQFGGLSAAFGAIGRDGAGIKIVGADGTSVSWIKVPGVTVANLPAAATAGAGARSFVTDATAPAFGVAVVGGGAVASPVYSDGAAWLVG